MRYCGEWGLCEPLKTDQSHCDVSQILHMKPVSVSDCLLTNSAVAGTVVAHVHVADSDSFCTILVKIYQSHLDWGGGGTTLK